MVQAVERALALLEHLDLTGAEGMALGELARAAGLKSPTARNLLQTLQATGYVDQDPASRRYSLGARAVWLGRGRFLTGQLRPVARRVLAAYRDRLRETCLLAVLHQGCRRTLLTVESDLPLRVGAAEGDDHHFYTTATGRMLLALLPADERQSLVLALGPPDAVWPEAADAGLEALLQDIRAAGVARLRAGGGQVQALAVPLHWADADLTAALGVYLPTARYDQRRDAELWTALRDAAAEIAGALERTRHD